MALVAVGGLLNMSRSDVPTSYPDLSGADGALIQIAKPLQAFAKIVPPKLFVVDILTKWFGMNQLGFEVQNERQAQIVQALSNLHDNPPSNLPSMYPDIDTSLWPDS